MRIKLPNPFLRLTGLGRASAASANPRGADRPALVTRKFTNVVIASDGDGSRGRHHGDYHVSEREIVATSELPPFAKTITSVVRDQFKHSICPIQLRPVEGQQERLFAIVLVRDILGNDIVDQIYEELQKTYRAAHPAVFVATQAVVSELARAATNTDVATRASADRDSPFYKMFADIASFALENGVSDIHFRYKKEEEYSQVGFRMDGNVIRPRKYRMSSDQMLRMLSFWYSFRGNSTSSSVYSVNEALQCQIEETIGGRRLGFRWAQLPIHKGMKVTLRVMRLDAGDAYKTLGEDGAGLPPYQVQTIRRAMRTDGGGWILSGRVNSGKSKLLQTIISLLPSHYEINTAEDPIEYIYQHDGANQHSTSRGLADDDDKDTFQPFKLANKRMDPDVTAISELRDRSTTGAFRDAVLAGQLGLTTIHAPSALAIPQRLMSEEFGLSRDVVTDPDFLKMLIHLGLVPKSCPSCSLGVLEAETAQVLMSAKDGDDAAVAEIAEASLRIVSPEFLRRIEGLFAINVAGMRVRNPFGCKHCRRDGVPELNGIHGRTPVAQIIEPTTEMLLLIRESKSIELHHYYRSLRVAGFDSDNSEGKSPLEVAMYKVSTGEICISQAERRFQTIDAYAHELARMKQGASRLRLE